MNARGISLFYGATDLDTAIAEVRPPVGSTVVAAEFKLVRPLKLLDLTELENAVEKGSIFDPTFKRRLERVAFMKSLSRLLTKPVMPDDEALEYLATQAVSDFLATENDPLLDGILFDSVQSKNGRNVVLFHKAARIVQMEIPEGTEIVVHSLFDADETPEFDYEVTEETPVKGQHEPMKEELKWRQIQHLAMDDGLPESDARLPSLAIDLETVAVHQIAWAKFEYNNQRVRRRRFEKSTNRDF